jgi:hypothetical protein
MVMPPCALPARRSLFRWTGDAATFRKPSPSPGKLMPAFRKAFKSMTMKSTRFAPLSYQASNLAPLFFHSPLTARHSS